MNKEPIKIRDLGLVTALISVGIPIYGTQNEKEGRVYFLFENIAKTQNYINDYWSDNLMVRARNYSDSMKMLKTRIYSEERNANFRK